MVGWLGVWLSARELEKTKCVDDQVVVDKVVNSLGQAKEMCHQLAGRLGISSAIPSDIGVVIAVLGCPVDGAPTEVVKVVAGATKELSAAKHLAEVNAALHNIGALTKSGCLLQRSAKDSVADDRLAMALKVLKDHRLPGLVAQGVVEDCIGDSQVAANTAPVGGPHPALCMKMEQSQPNEHGHDYGLASTVVRRNLPDQHGPDFAKGVQNKDLILDMSVVDIVVESLNYLQEALQMWSSIRAIEVTGSVIQWCDRVLYLLCLADTVLNQYLASQALPFQDKICDALADATPDGGVVTFASRKEWGTQMTKAALDSNTGPLEVPCSRAKAMQRLLSTLRAMGSDMTICPNAFCTNATTDVFTLLEADALVRLYTPMADAAEAMSYFHEHFLKDKGQVMKGSALHRKAEVCVSMLISARQEWEKAATLLDWTKCSITSKLAWGPSDVAAWMAATSVYTKMLQEFCISAKVDAMVSSSELVQKISPQYIHWLSDTVYNKQMVKRVMLKEATRVELNKELLALFHCMSSLGAIFQLWEVKPGIDAHPLTVEHVSTAQAIFGAGKVTITIIAAASIIQEKSGKEQLRGAKKVLDSRRDFLPKMLVDSLEGIVAAKVATKREPGAAKRATT